VAINPMCQIKAISRAVQKISFGFTLLQPTENVFVNLVGYVKTTANRFMPGFWKLTQNYCDLFSRRTTDTDFFLNAIEKLNPGFDYEQLKEYKCPLKVTK
jgi:Txe/YoeB family toxin of Txe-Axe toxin-antitoxin module